MRPPRIELETIASTTQNVTEMPEKPRKMSAGKRYISYQGRYFAVPSNYLRYLANIPENIRRSNSLAIKLGLMTIEDNGIFGCGYCNHQKDNPIAKILENPQVMIFNTVGTPGVHVEGCIYSREDLEYSANFTGPDGKKLDAWCTPCAARDAEIESLVTSGQLNEFQVSRDKIPEMPYINNLETKAKRADRKKRSNFERWKLIVRSWLR